MTKYFLIFMLLFAATDSLATTYYVKDGGNDGSAGTSWGTAWATVAKVNSSSTGGDTVWFGTGRYRGQLIPQSGGTANAKTVYACSSWTQGIAEIWGSDSISGWVQESGNVYRAYWNAPGTFLWDPNDDLAVVGQVDGTYDTILHAMTSLADVSAEGHYYHKRSVDTLYAWVFGGGDPDNVGMEASGRPTIMFTGADHVVIWGFRVRYGHYGGILFAANWAESDSCLISHCHVTRCGTHFGENACSIGGIGPVSPYGVGTVIRACTVGYAIEWDNINSAYIPYDSVGHLSKAMNWYSQRYLVVESCVVISDNDGAPLGHTGIDGKGWAQYHTYRFNTVYGGWARGISTFSNPDYDSAYGNIVIGPSGYPEYTGIWWGIAADGGDFGVVMNNTIYGYGDSGDFSGIEMGESGGWETWASIRYNVIHGINESARMVWLNNGTQNQVEIDSNMYYSSGTPAFYIGSAVTWANWQATYSFDVNSSTIDVDPGFNNPGAGDFSRPGASDEMNLTYGGRTWTVFGAVQSSGGVPCTWTSGFMTGGKIE